MKPAHQDRQTQFTVESNKMKKPLSHIALALILLLLLTDKAWAGRTSFVPDGGSSAGLLTLAVAGLIGVRRFMRR